MKKILILIIIIGSFLRLYKLTTVAPSLFGDELDVGYHAYSILKTGRDYHGNFMPLHFESLAEWRTPIYLYSSVPTVALFGISALGVRLPAAIFGILTIYLIYLLSNKLFENERIGLISAFLLAISPWHIQYSRAAFEVTQMLFFYLLGLYLFLYSIEKKKFLWISVLMFMLMPWVYSTAKFFVPFLLIFLFILYNKEILSFSYNQKLKTILTGLIFGLPLVYVTFFGGAAQRFSYVSVFSDPTIESEVGAARQQRAYFRGENGLGLNPNLLDRVYYNKYVFWGRTIINNYYQSFSTDFLFIKGDPNLRHSIEWMGQLYKADFILLVFGLVVLFNLKNKKIKQLILFLLIFSSIPASITRDGGNHATRLILNIVPLILILSLGFKYILEKNKLIFVFYFCLLLLGFVFYQNRFWTHNPWYSERWWHYGFEDSIDEIMNIEKDFNKVVISTQGEPPWIFFAAWSEYDPKAWQNHFPLDNKIYLDGYGEISHIDKYYFGSPDVDSEYEWPLILDNETLYLANAKEVTHNLVLEPQNTPPGLKLLRAVSYPSGEPAFYLFTKN